MRELSSCSAHVVKWRVNVFRAALGVLIVILPLTLGLRSVEHGERMIDTGRLAADEASSLTANGWSVRPLKHHLIGWLIQGERSGCRILVYAPPPEGETDEKFRTLAKSIGPVTYQYRGRTTRYFPRFVPVLLGNLQRYAWSFGVAVPTPALIATARSPSCGAQAPDFAGLRQHLEGN